MGVGGYNSISSHYSGWQEPMEYLIHPTGSIENAYARCAFVYFTYLSTRKKFVTRKFFYCETLCEEDIVL
jgi:hypothetical protein